MFFLKSRVLKRIWYNLRNYPERRVSLPDLPSFRFSTHVERDDYISKSIRDDGAWEHFETRVFVDQLSLGDVVIDIGANIGWYSVIASLHVGPAGKVVSFEPSDENYALLARNIRRNGLKNVLLHRAAIGAEDAIGKLYLSETNRGDHQLESHDNTRVSEAVSVKSLGSVLRRLGSKPSVLKIDTQGSEQRILQSVSRHDIDETSIFIEFWPYGLSRSGSSADGLLDILSSFGHQIFIIDHGSSRLIDTSIEELRYRAVSDLSIETGNFLDLFCLPPIRNRRAVAYQPRSYD